MAETLFLRLRLEEAEAMRRTVESWQSEHGPRVAAWDAADLVRMALEFPGRAEQLWQSAHRRAVTDHSLGVVELQELRRVLEVVLRNYVLMAEAAALFARSTEEAPVPGLAELEEAVGTLKRLCDRVA